MGAARCAGLWAVVAAAVPELQAAPVSESTLRERARRGGGARCTLDVDCGWHDPSILAKDRRDLPSGNGARCLVGRCVCADEFEDKYGCEKCTMRLLPRYSFADGLMEITSVVRDHNGVHMDLCKMPTGGAKCRVGSCRRDSRNRTVSCPGDSTCASAGAGTGICVGEQEKIGQCVCAENYFCQDCSLHRDDILHGEKCDRYVTGGAHCKSDDDCTQRGFCAGLLREEGKLVEAEFGSFCECKAGYTCRRCSNLLHDLEAKRATCACDDPLIKPDGGDFRSRHVEVSLRGGVWDSVDECQVHYFTQRITAAPMLEPSSVQSVDALVTSGEVQHDTDKGSEAPVVLAFDPLHAVSQGHIAGEAERFITSLDMFVIWAVAVPRPNTTWMASPSRIIRSKVFVLGDTWRAEPHTAWVLLLGLGFTSKMTLT